MSYRFINFAPITEASTAVQIHLVAAISALMLGALVLFWRKGNSRHRLGGRIWVGLMLVIAISSFWISEQPVFFGFGPIHVLSVMTLAGLYRGVTLARSGKIDLHQKGMRSLYFFALIAAGSFTLLPGRRMHAVLLERVPWLGDLPAGALAALIGVALVALFFRLRRAGMV